MITLTTGDIILRLLAAALFSGLIGFDREQKNHPAGIRTHILVCVGACIIALIQQEISIQALAISSAIPKFSGVVRADPARLIAQVVSGIGFLGAGTIVITRHSVTGLTTAASLWATAGVGLALGMGYYQIALGGALLVLLVLVILKKLIHVRTLKKIEIMYTNKETMAPYLTEFFKSNNVTISNCSFRKEADSRNTTPDHQVFTNIYTIELPKRINYPDLMAQLSGSPDVLQIRLVTI